MSRILIATVPGWGHINPMLTVGKELVSRGHEVRWYTGGAFQPKIEAIGARYEPMRSAFDHSGMTVEQAFPELQGLHGLRYFTRNYSGAAGSLSTASGEHRMCR